MSSSTQASGNASDHNRPRPSRDDHQHSTVRRSLNEMKDIHGHRSKEGVEPAVTGRHSLHVDDQSAEVTATSSGHITKPDQAPSAHQMKSSISGGHEPTTTTNKRLSRSHSDHLGDGHLPVHIQTDGGETSAGVASSVSATSRLQQHYETLAKAEQDLKQLDPSFDPGKTFRIKKDVRRANKAMEELKADMERANLENAAHVDEADDGELVVEEVPDDSINNLLKNMTAYEILHCSYLRLQPHQVKMLEERCKQEGINPKPHRHSFTTDIDITELYSADSNASLGTMSLKGSDYMTTGSLPPLYTQKQTTTFSRTKCADSDDENDEDPAPENVASQAANGVTKHVHAGHSKHPVTGSRFPPSSHMRQTHPKSPAAFDRHKNEKGRSSSNKTPRAYSKEIEVAESQVPRPVEKKPSPLDDRRFSALTEFLQPYDAGKKSDSKQQLGLNDPHAGSSKAEPK